MVVGGEHDNQLGLAGALSCQRAFVTMIRMIGSDDVQGQLCIPANQMVVEFAGVGVILAIALTITWTMTITLTIT